MQTAAKAASVQFSREALLNLHAVVGVSTVKRNYQ